MAMSLDLQQQQLLLERLDQMVQLQQQSNMHFEDLRKTHEEFQKRSIATIEALERRIRILEELPRDNTFRSIHADLPAHSSQIPTGTHMESSSTKEKHRNKVLTAEQTKFKRALCLEYKEFSGSLPPLEVRKSLAKKLYEQYRDDPAACLTMEVCEHQINNWFYDQMRNKARGSIVVAAGEGGTPTLEKKRAGRKRKTEGQGWAPPPVTGRDKADSEAGAGSSDDLETRAHYVPLHHPAPAAKDHVHIPHSHHHHHHHHGHHQHHSHVHEEHPFDSALSEFPD